jgi:ATP-dependent helicase/nuclease subunit B
MIKCSILPASCDLIAEVADLLVPAGKDYSGNLVVFPGKRPAHFLRKALADRMQTAYVPPAILSMEEFIDHTYETMTHSSRRKLETIDAVAFLFDIHRVMERPLWGEGFLNLDTFFSLGLRIFRDLEELVIEDVDRSKFLSIESSMQGALPPETGRSLQSLSFFFDNFYPAINQAGFSSRSERYRFVSSSVIRETIPQTKIVFVGFYGLTTSEKRLFEKVLDWDNAFLLFRDGPGLRRHLSFLEVDAMSGELDTSDEREPHPVVHFHKSADSHGQVFGLAAALKEQMESALQQSIGPTGERHTHEYLSANTTAIILPSPETLFAVLHHALPIVPGGNYNISLGYPLERTPTWGFLSSLIRLGNSMDGERFYVPDYLDLVLHPYTKNIYLDGTTEITRIMFHAIEEMLLQDRTKSFVSLDEIEGNAALFRHLASRLAGNEHVFADGEIREHLKTIHNELIRKLDAFHDIGDFAEKIITVLSYIYDHSSARLHPFFHPFAESFLQHLDLVKKSRVRSLAFSEKRGYFHFLTKYVAHCSAPFDGTPLSGVQVLGILETRNLRFDHTYILDVNEDVIPDTRKEDSFIPLSVRQTIGLPTYRDRDMLSAYYFDALVRGSREVHIFFAENARKERSRFVEKLLWERQIRDHAKSTTRYVASLNYRLSLERCQPSAIIKTSAMSDFLRSRPFDATSLDAYLRCPLQFYYRYVLNMVKKDETRSDVERVDIGRLVHRIMSAYFEKRTGIVISTIDIDLTEMRSIVGSLFDEIYGIEPVGRVYLLRRQVLRQMEAYLQHYEIPLISSLPVTILHLEHRLERSVGGFTFRGILDRIDSRGGKTCIVDYKTTTSARRYATDFSRLMTNERSSWAKAIGSIQLPFYLFLSEGDGGAHLGDREAMFLFLGRAHLDQSMELPLFRREDDPCSAYEKARTVIFSLVNEVVDPLVPFDPLFRKDNACVFCDYRYLCGTQ